MWSCTSVVNTPGLNTLQIKYFDITFKFFFPEFGYIDEVLEQNKANEEEEEEDEEEEEVAEKVAGGEEEEEEDENNDGWEICSSEEEMDGWSDNDEGWIDVEHSEKEEEVQVSEILLFCF